MDLLPVILAGGSGTRLWPLSRTQFPKQFHVVGDGDFTMLQQTVKRLQGVEHSPPLIVCNEEHRFLVAEQLRIINRSTSGIILEPVGRNTAPAIALAALHAVQNGRDPILLVLAADHVISNEPAFRDLVCVARQAVLNNKLVTFGIVPTKPHTGYGYIRSGDALGVMGEGGYQVDAFVEKPDLETATSYLNAGGYFWNSGMFMLRASQLLTELKAHRADIYDACVAAYQAIETDRDFYRIPKQLFDACPEESIDYAVMEQTASAVVYPLDAGWSDVGSWTALDELNTKDAEGNSAHGDVYFHHSKNCMVRGGERLIVTLGVSDLVVVDTKDALLVADKEHCEDIKTVVGQLKSEDRSHYRHHREVLRPWGCYDSIDIGARYQVKRLTVNPGEKLSLQLHHHRAEHWVVVSGTARVVVGDETIVLSENESAYIPVGVKHSLENPGKIPLDLIEVQSGSYLGEDDIVRFEDKYRRI